MSKKPIIGITVDCGAPSKDDPNPYSRFVPWYVLRQNYSEAVTAHGGIPVFLAYHAEVVSNYIDHLDGLIISGGDFDIDPGLFGEKKSHPSVTTKPERTQFEWAITKQAYDTGMPIFGICGGMQLLNVIMGGTLIQHIPAEIDKPLPHVQTLPHYDPSHPILLEEKSKLFTTLAGTKKLMVNSTHHQAVKKLAANFKLAAEAPDGVIEAFEDKKHPFCVGVQWHPEYQTNPLDKGLFDTMIKTAKKYNKKKNAPTKTK